MGKPTVNLVGAPQTLTSDEATELMGQLVALIEGMGLKEGEESKEQIVKLSGLKHRVSFKVENLNESTNQYLVRITEFA